MFLFQPPIAPRYDVHGECNFNADDDCRQRRLGFVVDVTGRSPRADLLPET